MNRDLTIQVDEELYRQIVERSGGQRKISKFLVPIIKAALATQEDAAVPEIAVLHKQVTDLAERVQILEAKRDQ